MARLSRDPVIPEFLPLLWRELLSAMTARDPDSRPSGRELVSMLRQVVIADSARHKDTEGDSFLPRNRIPRSVARRSSIRFQMKPCTGLPRWQPDCSASR